MPGLGDSDPPDDVRDVWSVTHCVEDGDEGAAAARTSTSPSPASPSAAWWRGHIATLFDERISRIVMVGAGGLKATRKPGPKLRKLLAEMPAETLAAEARRNLEILMLHDPANVDGVAIYMQIMNTTRAKTRSRDMGQRCQAQRSAAARQDAAHRHLGRVRIRPPIRTSRNASISSARCSRTSR